MFGRKDSTRKIELSESIMLALELTREAVVKAVRAEVWFRAVNIFPEAVKETPSRSRATRVITIHGKGNSPYFVLFESECTLSRVEGLWRVDYGNLEVDERGNKRSFRVT